MLQYTICFIRKGNKILLLNRNKQPNMGMWNGVGGKIEVNETSEEGVIRETFEETGIALTQVTSVGDVVWESNRGNSGMHVFLAELPLGIDLPTPEVCDEGILDWKEIDWILNAKNSGVVDNIKNYLPAMLEGKHDLIHRFNYENGVMIGYKCSSLK